MSELLAPKGHNRPPLVEFYSEQNEQLPGYLESENADLVKRKTDLLAAFARAPITVDDDETCGRMGDFSKQLGACVKEAEARRQAAKEPTLQAGRIIDGFFKKSITEGVDSAKRTIGDRMTGFLRKKEEAERRRREEEERAARAAADEARKQAAAAEAQMRTEADLVVATAAHEEAAQKAGDALKAAQAAEAKASELSRTRGDYGALASLRTEIVGEVDEVLPTTLQTLAPFIAKEAVEKALRLAIRNGIRDVPGCRIFERKTAAVR